MTAPRLGVTEALARELGGTGKPVIWEELTSQETVAVMQQRAAILPLGATEQHGPHMPLCVDSRLAFYVAEAVSALTGVPVLPPVTFGVSGSHGGFPGTLSLRSETFIAAIGDIIDSLYRTGVRQIVLLNGHAWNQAPLEVCVENARTRHDDLRVRALRYAESYPGSEIDGRFTYGRGLAHANYFETSCMLAIAPDLVKLDRAVAKADWPSFWDYRLDQVSASGVWGRDIPEATAEHGASELARCIETTARAAAAGCAEPWPEAT